MAKKYLEAALTDNTNTDKGVTQKIVIVDAGWVFCGETTYREHFTGTQLRLDNCYNIRVWGTSQGLGELALKGALSETVLDFYGVVTLPVNKVVGVIDCLVEIKK